MSNLPPAKTPLNQHSLIALESWLCGLGAIRTSENPSLWDWQSFNWNAQIILDREELCVVWENGATNSKRCFSYALSRNDVEAAIREGP